VLTVSRGDLCTLVNLHLHLLKLHKFDIVVALASVTSVVHILLLLCLIFKDNLKSLWNWRSVGPSVRRAPTLATVTIIYVINCIWDARIWGQWNVFTSLLSSSIVVSVFLSVMGVTNWGFPFGRTFIQGFSLYLSENSVLSLERHVGYIVMDSFLCCVFCVLCCSVTAYCFV
jgi:hypothetical protein